MSAQCPHYILLRFSAQENQGPDRSILQDVGASLQQTFSLTPSHTQLDHIVGNGSHTCSMGPHCHVIISLCTYIVHILLCQACNSIHEYQVIKMRRFG